MSQNLLKIYDGRTSFWQWDRGQQLVILSDSVTDVHLSHKGVKSSKKLDIKIENNMRVCDIPDVFLQVPKNLVVYAVQSQPEVENTITSVEIAVRLRPQPDGYISVHDNEYVSINARIDHIEKKFAEGVVTEDDVNQYIEDALKTTMNIDEGVAVLDGGEVMSALTDVMTKYITKLRRGTAQDWIDYESSEKYKRPAEGELVIEYNGSIPTLKIGDGKHEYSELPSISVDSQILPTRTYVSIKGGEENWPMAVDKNGTSLGYRYQKITITDVPITPNSKIDLQLTTDELVAFYAKSLAFMVENNNGDLSVVCVGQIPQHDWRFRATVTEVVIDG